MPVNQPKNAHGRKAFKKEAIAKTRTIRVVADADSPESLDILAKSIIEVAAFAKGIEQSRLKQSTVVLLIQDYIGARNITRNQIEDVLNAAAKLKDVYTK